MRIRVALALVGLLLAGLPSSAAATFPGPWNGQVAYTRSYQGDSYIARSDYDGGDTFAMTGPAEHPDSPAWSPDGRTIAYAGTFGGNTDIYTLRYDGSERTRVTTAAANDLDPAWSPDGQTIAFASDRSGAYQLCLISPDGSNERCPRDELGQPLIGRRPNWSPDGQRIAFERSGHLWVVSPDGTGLAQLPIAGVQGNPCCDARPNWSPDGQRIAFESTRRSLQEEILIAHADGSGAVVLSQGRDPAWQPDGTRVFFVAGACNSIYGDTCIRSAPADGPGFGPGFDEFGVDEGEPDFGSYTPSFAPYVRPRGATPFKEPLVPAYDQCPVPESEVEPNSSHGGPLAFPSCAPPAQSSHKLTFGTPDANGQPASSVGSVQLRAVLGDPHTSADEADVRIDGRLTDVRCRAAGPNCAGGALSDFTGTLNLELQLRITDKANPAYPNPYAATSKDGYVPVDMPCMPTSDSSRGSDCSVSTSLKTLYPPQSGYLSLEGSRAIWQVVQIRIMDKSDDFGGLPLAVPGLFVP